MAKLTGAKKKAFLERMAKGRRKQKRKTAPAAKKANPKKRKPAAKKAAAKKQTPGRAAKRKPATRPTQAHHKHARPAKKAAAGRKPNGKRRRNSSDAEASAMFETFHQKAPRQIVELESITKYPDRFAELGKLKELRVELDPDNPDFPLTKFGPCLVVCTPDGRNIYFLQGDMSLDLAALDIGSDKDIVELGPCNYIAYHTVKGFHDFEPTTYEHEFGEENGIVPLLLYDRLNEALFLAGGDYQVRYEGIVN